MCHYLKHNFKQVTLLSWKLKSLSHWGGMPSQTETNWASTWVGEQDRYMAIVDFHVVLADFPGEVKLTELRTLQQTSHSIYKPSPSKHIWTHWTAATVSSLSCPPPPAGPVSGSQPPSAGGGSVSTGNPLEFLRNQPQFQQMRQIIQQNPSLLPALLQQLGRDNPQLLQVQHQHAPHTVMGFCEGLKFFC